MIDKLKLGDEVKERIERGQKDTEIADEMGLEVEAVTKWRTKNMPVKAVVAKLAAGNSNIFDLSSRLPELLGEVVAFLNEAKQSGDMESRGKALGEIRQSLKLAKEVLETVALYEENERFKEAYLDILKEECGEIARAKVIARLTELRDNKSSVRLPGDGK